uniref:Longitudinals lacking protein-like n=1 Tax=Caligus clemensi TaxID=344056 RepID=C1C2P9_CALCM|nr:Longitudinals lacking protein-like [Caligus clemensi]
MGSSAQQEVFVRWNDFSQNFKEGFCDLRENEELFDITLAASDYRVIRAHKVILCACSSFFRSLLRNVSSAQQTHPLIYLRGIDFHHLEAILSFIYNGEVKVCQEDLSELLAVARESEIKGLSNSLDPKQTFVPQRVIKEERQDVLLDSGGSSSSVGGKGGFAQSGHDEASDEFDEDGFVDDPILATQFIDTDDDPPCDNNDDGMELLMDMKNDESVFNESESLKGLNYASQKSGYTQALNSEISKCFHLHQELKKYLCKMCEYTSPRRDTMRSHVEAMHIITDGFECAICGKIYKTRNSLKTHKIRTHKRKKHHFP